MHHLQELLPREEALTKKSTVNNENGTPSGATLSFQANGQSNSTD
jgi:hypothetical protein